MSGGDELPVPQDPELAMVMRVSLALLAVNERLVEHWNAHAGAKGLTGAHAKVLLGLSAQEPISMRQLARALSFDASNLTSVIDRLEDRGLVRRGRDDADRRSRPVTLTRAGEELRAAFWNDLTHDRGPLAPLGGDELETLLRIVGSLSAHEPSG